MFKSGLLLTAAALMLIFSGCGHLTPKKQKIRIQGEVRRPGVYLIQDNIVYIVAIMGARGYTFDADPSKVIIDRKSKSVILDMSTPKGKPGVHLAEKFLVRGGDVITIPKKKK
jgi:protein involved in polysaccharide export with SLBB domain